MGTRWRACSSSPYRLGDADDEGEHRLLVDRYLGTLDVGLARDVEQLLATEPSELHALTADLSAGETEALLERLLDVHGERERAKSPQQLHAELRAVWQREHELLEEARRRCWPSARVRVTRGKVASTNPRWRPALRQRSHPD